MKSKKDIPKKFHKTTYILPIMLQFFPRWPDKAIWRRLLIGLLIIFLFFSSTAYTISQWYVYHNASKPLTYGVSFIPDYAQSLGLNPRQTMKALVKIGVKQFRLVSYWSDIEPTAGVYNFSQLDWEFKTAEAAHATVSLSLGLRQPRWPECHAPSWVNTSAPQSIWQPKLEKFMAAVVNRYKSSPALQSYQVENEYFLKGFGICTNFSRSRLISEYKLVKRLDHRHTVIINRSNNGLGIAINSPTPEEYGISIYRRVWDGTLTKRYFEYPIPAWYYGFLAGIQMAYNGRDTIIHEMQAEAWAPNGKQLTQISLAEQNKSLNAHRLENRFNYAKATGMRTIDMWGAEYWYYRLIIKHDPSLWNVAKHEFKTSLN